jgi:hypothetical protein
MYWTSLTPISFSVPPFCGVPGLSAPPVAAPDAAGDDAPLGLLALPLLDPELLHAATARAETATAPTAMVRKRNCLTTQVLLISTYLLGEGGPPGSSGRRYATLC